MTQVRWVLPQKFHGPIRALYIKLVGKSVTLVFRQIVEKCWKTVEKESEPPPNVGPIPTCLDGIEQIENATLRKTPQKEKPSFLNREPDKSAEKEAPKTPKKTPKKTNKSPAKSSKSVRKGSFSDLWRHLDAFLGMTPKKTKRALQLSSKSPDVKRMKQLKMDYFSPAKSSPQKSPRSKSPAQSPFKMPKSPRSRYEPGV